MEITFPSIRKERTVDVAFREVASARNSEFNQNSKNTFRVPHHSFCQPSAEHPSMFLTELYGQPKGEDKR